MNNTFSKKTLPLQTIKLCKVDGKKGRIQESAQLYGQWKFAFVFLEEKPYHKLYMHTQTQSLQQAAFQNEETATISL